MSADIWLRCHQVERYLGEDESRVHALRGISLDLEAGTVHAVVGPSGCGKSTLLYILGLLDQPDGGWVKIGSELVSDLHDNALARKRNELIGFIFQFHFLLEDFTTLENVMIPMRRLGRWSEREMMERASALLEAVDLADKLRRPSRHLSGGEQQRVAIARAFSGEPRVLMADEPTGNLDGATGSEVADLMFRLNRERGTTLLLVTHDTALASRCARRLSLAGGRLVEDAALTEGRPPAPKSAAPNA
jgi:lipoprotein-releasing system ATP-binding protein